MRTKEKKNIKKPHIIMLDKRRGIGGNIYWQH